jgi:hypothetical protein
MLSEAKLTQHTFLLEHRDHIYAFSLYTKQDESTEQDDNWEALRPASKSL